MPSLNRVSEHMCRSWRRSKVLSSFPRARFKSVTAAEQLGQNARCPRVGTDSCWRVAGFPASASGLGRTQQPQWSALTKFAEKAPHRVTPSDRGASWMCDWSPGASGLSDGERITEGGGCRSERRSRDPSSMFSHARPATWEIRSRSSCWTGEEEQDRRLCLDRQQAEHQHHSGSKSDSGCVGELEGSEHQTVRLCGTVAGSRQDEGPED